MNKEKGTTRSERYREQVARFRLMDDMFMTKCFDSSEAGFKSVGKVLEIMLEQEDLTIVSSRVQDEFMNLQGRSLKLDILAKDAEGRLYNIEIQRSRSGASPKRARYHSSLIDANTLMKGESEMCEIMEELIAEETAKVKAETTAMVEAETAARVKAETAVENSEEIAKKLLAIGEMSVEAIAGIVNLPVERIKNLLA